MHCNITSLCCFRILAHILWLYLSLAQRSFGTRDGFTHQTDRLPAGRNDQNMKTWVILKFRASTRWRCWVKTKQNSSVWDTLISFCESGPKIVAYESGMCYCSWWYPENRVCWRLILININNNIHILILYTKYYTNEMKIFFYRSLYFSYTYIYRGQYDQNTSIFTG